MRYPTFSSVKTKLINLGITLLTVVVMLAVAEVIVRWLFKDVTTTSDGRGYFARQWYKSHRPIENSFGFREREFLREKPIGTYRIAVIGDSFTYGQGVREGERYTNLLQQMLDDRAGRYEVLNFAREGMETIDHLEVLKDIVLPANPDFVLLQWFTNDVEGRDKSKRPQPMPLLPWRRVNRNLLAGSALVFLVNERWSRLQEDLGITKTYADYMKERFGDRHSPESLASERTLEQLIDVCKQQEVPLGIVLFANPYGGGGPLDFLLERVLSLCERKHLVCVDTRSTFAAYGGDERDFWVNPLDAHPGPLAHRIVASRLMEVLADRWVKQ